MTNVILQNLPAGFVEVGEAENMSYMNTWSHFVQYLIQSHFLENMVLSSVAGYSVYKTQYLARYMSYIFPVQIYGHVFLVKL